MILQAKILVAAIPDTNSEIAFVAQENRDSHKAIMVTITGGGSGITVNEDMLREALSMCDDLRNEINIMRQDKNPNRVQVVD